MTKFGNYEVLRELGRGAMGVVYLARHASIGKLAAIKTIAPKHAGNAELVQRFFNEAKAAAGIGHPALIDVYDFGKDEESGTYLVMEYLQGETLGDRIKRGPLATSLLVEIAKQIASALQATHAAKVVHRDLKPDNIFLVDDPTSPVRVKVVDFGVAKLAPTLAGLRTVSGTMVGTPAYMSPEQCRGDADVAAPSDMYALGVLIFEMQSGQLPFAAANFGEVIAAHLKEAPRPLAMLSPEVPKELAALVASLLDKDPAARPTASQVEEVLGELRRSLGAIDLGSSEPRAGAQALGEQDTRVKAAIGTNSTQMASVAVPVSAGQAGAESTTVAPLSSLSAQTHSPKRSFGVGMLVAVAIVSACAAALAVLLLSTSSNADSTSDSTGGIATAQTGVASGEVTEASIVEGAAQTPELQGSGVSIEDPMLITLGTEIEGTLACSKHRYYQFDVVAGQNETIELLVKLENAGAESCSVDFTLLDELGDELADDYVFASSENFAKKATEVVFAKTESITIMLSSTNAKGGIVHYKIKSAAR